MALQPFGSVGIFSPGFGKDGESLVVKCGFDERDFRIQANPRTFFTTDHYRGYPTVLVRLATVTAIELAEVLEQAWRLKAPTRVLAEYDKRAKSARR